MATVTFETKNGSNYFLVEQDNGLFMLARFGMPAPVEFLYYDMEIIELVLDRPAEIKSKIPGDGHIFTSEVVRIEYDH